MSDNTVNGQYVSPYVNSVILRRVRDRLERGFAQEYLALDSEGRRVYYDSPEAVKFCLIGAVHREFNGKTDGDYVVEFLDTRVPQEFQQAELAHPAAEFNDKTDKETVLSFLDGLIKELEDAGR